MRVLCEGSGIRPEVIHSVGRFATFRLGGAIPLTPERSLRVSGRTTAEGREMPKGAKCRRAQNAEERYGFGFATATRSRRAFEYRNACSRAERRWRTPM